MNEFDGFIEQSVTIDTEEWRNARDRAYDPAVNYARHVLDVMSSPPPPIRAGALDTTECGLCDEHLDPQQEVGEFWDEEKQDSVVAHAGCGLSRGMEPA